MESQHLLAGWSTQQCDARAQCRQNVPLRSDGRSLPAGRAVRTQTGVWLHGAVGPFEGVLVGSACRAALRGDWTSALAYNDFLDAGITPRTLRQASRSMGDQLLQLAEAWPWASDTIATLQGATTPERAGWHHAIVFATLAAAAGSSPVDAVAVYLHQAALGCIGAGV